MLEACVDAVVSRLGAAMARIWMLEADTSLLALAASAGLTPELEGKDRKIPLGQFHIGRVARDNQSVLTNSFGSDSTTINPAWVTREGLVALAGCPLEVDGKVIGVLALFSREELPASSLRGLETVARGCAQAIGRLNALATLRASQASLQRMMDGSNDGFWEWHVPSGALLYSPRLTEMLGSRSIWRAMGWKRSISCWAAPRRPAPGTWS